MTDEIETVGKVADATKEVAKTGGKAIDAASGAGRFFGRVMGDLVEDGIGLVSDRLKFYRHERSEILADKTQKKLAKNGIRNIRALPPKIAIPLIESAIIENEEYIQELWSNLLANGLSPKAQEIKRSYISILNDMAANDAQLFLKIKKLQALDVIDGKVVQLDDAVRSVPEDAIVNWPFASNEDRISVSNLERLGLLERPFKDNFSSFMKGLPNLDEFPPKPKENYSTMLKLSALGESFYSAIS